MVQGLRALTPVAALYSEYDHHGLCLRLVEKLALDGACGRPQRLAHGLPAGRGMQTGLGLAAMPGVQVDRKAWPADWQRVWEAD